MDDDVFAAGPIAQELSATFDEFWNSPMAIPIEALTGGKPSAQDLEDYRGVLAAHHARMVEADAPYMRLLLELGANPNIANADGSDAKLGRVALASFTAIEGLRPVGDSHWRSTTATFSLARAR